MVVGVCGLCVYVCVGVRAWFARGLRVGCAHVCGDACLAAVFVLLRLHAPAFGCVCVGGPGPGPRVRFNVDLDRSSRLDNVRGPFW